MKTYKYRTLRGLLRQTDDLNLYGILSGRNEGGRSSLPEFQGRPLALSQSL